MLNVFDAGEGSFRLCDRHDEEIGWIRGSALGFDGLATEADALAAAVAGHAALGGWIARLTATVPPKGKGSGRMRLVHDGAYEWITRGDAPLARLYRPEIDHPVRRRRRTFGVEFVLPSYVKAGSAIGAAQVVHHAISRCARVDAAELAHASPP